MPPSDKKTLIFTDMPLFFRYSVLGTIQDFAYNHTNCLGLTLELSCEKNPSSSTLKDEWTKNKESLLKLLEAVHIGIKGKNYTSLLIQM